MNSFEVADKAIGQKVFDTEKRIISGVEKLDTMRFIVGRFTFFLLKLSCCPESFSLLRLDDFSKFR